MRSVCPHNYLTSLLERSLVFLISPTVVQPQLCCKVLLSDSGCVESIIDALPYSADVM